MNYDGMKINVLKRDKDTKQIKKRGLISLAANLVVNNNNSGTSVSAHYDRNIYKSFFNLVWKTMFCRDERNTWCAAICRRLKIFKIYSFTGYLKLLKLSLL